VLIRSITLRPGFNGWFRSAPPEGNSFVNASALAHRSHSLVILLTNGDIAFLHEPGQTLG
jgi:hypothetical protein